MRNTVSLLILGVLVSSAMADIPEPRFDAQTIDDGVEIGYGVATGDVNGNGRIDILLADKSQIVWYRNPGTPGEAWDRFVMAEDLTQRDNVCIAARDITGDGRVEVAVGAQWNPGETDDAEQSGALFYLHRPDDPTELWTPRRIQPHDPTTHRMRWVRAAQDDYRLVVLPLHGIGNRQGEGDGVRVQIVTPPDDLADGEWESTFVETEMNMTHNLEVIAETNMAEEIALIVGRQGIGAVVELGREPMAFPPPPLFQHAGGEIRARVGGDNDWHVLATIEPMHGNSVVAYSGPEDVDQPTRHVLDDTLNAGHALGVHDFLDIGRPQVVAGWRLPDDDDKVGVRMYVPLDQSGENWATHTIDDNEMAAEDLAVADFSDNGHPDIVAAGRATHNLIIYWNRTHADD